jgi:hypothetical protein
LTARVRFPGVPTITRNAEGSGAAAGLLGENLAKQVLQTFLRPLETSAVRIDERHSDRDLRVFRASGVTDRHHRATAEDTTGLATYTPSIHSFAAISTTKSHCGSFDPTPAM